MSEAKRFKADLLERGVVLVPVITKDDDYEDRIAALKAEFRGSKARAASPSWHLVAPQDLATIRLSRGPLVRHGLWPFLVLSMQPPVGTAGATKKGFAGGEEGGAGTSGPAAVEVTKADRFKVEASGLDEWSQWLDEQRKVAGLDGESLVYIQVQARANGGHGALASLWLTQ